MSYFLFTNGEALHRADSPTAARAICGVRVSPDVPVTMTPEGSVLRYLIAGTECAECFNDPPVVPEEGKDQ